MPEPPVGFLRAMLECPRCGTKRQKVIAENGLPRVGHVIKTGDGFGPMTCPKCRADGFAVVTSRPKPPETASVPGWNVRKVIIE